MHTKTHRANLSPQKSESVRFLNSTPWRKLRKLKLAKTPWCEQCERDQVPLSVPATDVDHIQPRHLRPDLNLMLSNLQSLCKSCHSKKTQQEQSS
jgi:5-methylcytosine-specific restriction enzyme A